MRGRREHENVEHSIPTIYIQKLNVFGCTEPRCAPIPGRRRRSHGRWWSAASASSAWGAPASCARARGRRRRRPARGGELPVVDQLQVLLADGRLLAHHVVAHRVHSDAMRARRRLGGVLEGGGARQPRRAFAVAVVEEGGLEIVGGDASASPLAELYSCSTVAPPLPRLQLREHRRELVEFKRAVAVGVILFGERAHALRVGVGDRAVLRRNLISQASSGASLGRLPSWAPTRRGEQGVRRTRLRAGCHRRRRGVGRRRRRPCRSGSAISGGSPVIAASRPS